MDWLKSVCAPFSSNQSVWEKVREGHGSEGPWHDDDHWWACRPGSCCEARASTRTTRPKQTPAHTHNRWRPEGLCCGRKDARASSIPSLAGVGIVFRARDGHLLVAEVTADGPAQHSGKVVPGQKLLMMSGTRVAGLDTTDIAGLVLGPVGSHAELVLENADSSVVRVQLVRRKTRETMPLVHTRRQRQASSPSAHSTSRKHQEELLEMAHEQVRDSAEVLSTCQILAATLNLMRPKQGLKVIYGHSSHLTAPEKDSSPPVQVRGASKCTEASPGLDIGQGSTAFSPRCEHNRLRVACDECAPRPFSPGQSPFDHAPASLGGLHSSRPSAFSPPARISLRGEARDAGRSSRSPRVLFTPST